MDIDSMHNCERWCGGIAKEIGVRALSRTPDSESLSIQQHVSVFCGNNQDGY
jgi:hypothetical protein